MSMTMPFNPVWGSNQLLTLAAATEQHIAVNKDNRSLRVNNTGATNPLYFKTYNSGSTVRPILAPTATTPAQTLASTADFRVGPGQDKIITFALDHDGVSLISALGTTVEVMSGTGGI